VNKSSRTLILLYVLLGYVVIQFAWWGVLLYELNVEMALVTSGPGSGHMAKAPGRTLTMILGEGTVFLSLLLIGAFYIRKYLLREQKLARQVRNFLLATTHEFNSPIAAAKLNLQTLKRKEMDAELRAQVVDGALSAVTRLENLVSNVLMASRIDSGKFELHCEPVNLDHLFRGLTRRFEQVAAETGNKIVLSVEQEGVFEADAAALELVAGNLIQNAIKYAPGTGITVRVNSRNGEADISVADEGPGIPDDEKENVFRKFYRMGNEETRSRKGTGLGLYLARELVHMHRGTIQLKNNRPRGTLFKIHIPNKK